MGLIDMTFRARVLNARFMARIGNSQCGLLPAKVCSFLYLGPGRRARRSLARRSLRNPVCKDISSDNREAQKDKLKKLINQYKTFHTARSINVDDRMKGKVVAIRIVSEEGKTDRFLRYLPRFLPIKSLIRKLIL